MLPVPKPLFAPGLPNPGDSFVLNAENEAPPPVPKLDVALPPAPNPDVLPPPTPKPEVVPNPLLPLPNPDGAVFPPNDIAPKVDVVLPNAVLDPKEVEVFPNEVDPNDGWATGLADAGDPKLPELLEAVPNEAPPNDGAAALALNDDEPNEGWEDCVAFVEDNPNPVEELPIDWVLSVAGGGVAIEGDFKKAP